jgi:hypothetical protein
MTAPITTAAAGGNQMSPASRIMLMPIAQMTCSNTNGNPKFRPNATTVSSSTISHAPRVSRKRESCGLLLPFTPCR